MGSSSFVATAMAHDMVCPKGQEWVFHGMSSTKTDNVLDLYKGLQPRKDGEPHDSSAFSSRLSFKEAAILFVMAMFVILAAVLASVGFFLN